MKINSNISIFRLLFILLSFWMFLSCQSVQDETHQLTAEDFMELQSKKKQITSGDQETINFFNNLIKEAEEALNSGPFSVVNKTGIPPSGDKHDYMSLAPYWWPDPEKPDGLPYIRRDGEVNPEARNNFSDYSEKAKFFNAVEILGKAYFYSNDERYAEKAVSLIKIWFIDEATIMNPHLDFAQGVRGRSDGRCYGVIEFGGIREVITSLELLKIGGALSEETENGVKKWLKAYSEWLQTSELGSMEDSRLNNHGTTYDVQLCTILLYLGEEEQVKNRLTTITKPRIVSQIESDGSQPLELARTKAFSYSVMNLEAFTRLAWYGERLDIDLWNYESEDGRSLRKAYEFLIPYVATDKQWEYQQISQMESSRNRFARLLMYAGEKLGESHYIKIANEYFERQKQNLNS